MIVADEIEKYCTDYHDLGLRLADILSFHEDGWKKRSIAQRRETQELFSNWRSALEAADKDKSGQARDAFSKMRSAIALHQAEWPVVAIDLDDPEYQRSVKNIQTLNSACIAASLELVAALRIA